MSDNKLTKFQELIGYKFNKDEILRMALTHRSYALERNLDDYYERLEFLGDSVLSACVCAILYEKFPNLSEGELSKMKSQIVSADNISAWAHLINLGSFILLGKNENGIKGMRKSKNLLCDCFESIVGAVFIDGGFEQAMKLVKSFAERQEICSNDYKSRLQEMAQSRFKTIPEYKLKKTSGPDHNKSFEVEVLIENNYLGVGSGKSKKEAEQNAAQQAIANIDGVKSPLL